MRLRNCWSLIDLFTIHACEHKHHCCSSALKLRKNFLSFFVSFVIRMVSQLDTKRTRIYDWKYVLATKFFFNILKTDSVTDLSKFISLTYAFEIGYLRKGQRTLKQWCLTLCQFIFCSFAFSFIVAPLNRNAAVCWISSGIT